MRKRSGLLGGIIDHPWYIVLVAGVAAFAVWAVGTRSSPHHLRAYFPSAFNLVTGQNVNVDGLTVGKVSGLEFDGTHAIVDIGINDDRFWPLHAGTQLTSRWGTTIGSGTRYLDLVPGPASAPALPDNGILPTKDNTAAIDVDQVLNVFNSGTRTALRGWMGGMDSALGRRSTQINQALHSTAPALGAVDGVMTDLARDSYALRTFITNTHNVTQTLAGRSPALENLISNAASTFNAFASNSSNLTQSIHDLPGTLDQTRSTLARTDSSIVKLQTLITALAPGAARLTPLAQSAQPAFAMLRATLPSTISTVDAATRAAPRLTALMHAATPFVQRAPYDFTTLGSMLGCIRPYAPEAAGAVVSAGNWVSTYDLLSPKLPEAGVTNAPTLYEQHTEASGRAHVHDIMAMPQASTASLHSYPVGVTSKLYTQLTGKQYAYPRPPGLNVGRPWFLPQCDITPAALNPAADPEAHTPAEASTP